VLDVDQGFSIGGTGEAQVAGTGGGGGGSFSRSGQWGSKTMGQQEAANVRATESSRESRETLSHTTQLSQMYNLFQAYHLGTNRALFWVGPRPHVLEEPSALVRGPRPVDGIQELFLVVSQPESQDDPCISVRLDTAHLTQLPLMELDHKAADHQPEAQASASAPAEGTGLAIESDDPLYDCFEVRKTASDAFEAPPGYSVEDTEDLVNAVEGTGVTDVQVSADEKNVNVTAEATGRACYRNDAGDVANTAALVAGGAAATTPVAAPLVGAVVGGVAAAAGADVIPETKGKKKSGSAHRKVRVKLVSEQPIKQVGTYEALVITTRGLCCCEDLIDDGKIIDVDLRPDPSDLDWDPFDDPSQPWNQQPGLGLGWNAFGMQRSKSRATGERRDVTTPLMAARAANAKAEAIGRSLRRTVTRVSDPASAPALDAPFLIQRLLAAALTSPRGRRALRRPATKAGVPPRARARIARALARDSRGLTAYEVAAGAAQVTSSAEPGDKRQAARAAIAALGIPLRRRGRRSSAG
jgi:hypothetical protein